MRSLTLRQRKLELLAYPIPQRGVPCGAISGHGSLFDAPHKTYTNQYLCFQLLLYFVWVPKGKCFGEAALSHPSCLGRGTAAAQSPKLGPDAGRRSPSGGKTHVRDRGEGMRQEKRNCWKRLEWTFYKRLWCFYGLLCTQQ